MMLSGLFNSVRFFLVVDQSKLAHIKDRDPNHLANGQEEGDG